MAVFELLVRNKSRVLVCFIQQVLRPLHVCTWVAMLSIQTSPMDADCHGAGPKQAEDVPINNRQHADQRDFDGHSCAL